MPRLAARGSLLHPKATTLWQNMLNEPSQQEKKRGKFMCVWREESRRERIREGSGGVRWPFNLESLMCVMHIWLPKMMDSATHTLWESDPSFFYLLPSLLLVLTSISQHLISTQPPAPPQRFVKKNFITRCSPTRSVKELG